MTEEPHPNTIVGQLYRLYDHLRQSTGEPLPRERAIDAANEVGVTSSTSTVAYASWRTSRKEPVIARTRRRGLARRGVSFDQLRENIDKFCGLDLAAVGDEPPAGTETTVSDDTAKPAKKAARKVVNKPAKKTAVKKAAKKTVKKKAVKKPA